jgi:hypothetical protein
MNFPAYLVWGFWLTAIIAFAFGWHALALAFLLLGFAAWILQPHDS